MSSWRTTAGGSVVRADSVEVATVEADVVAFDAVAFESSTGDADACAGAPRPHASADEANNNRAARARVILALLECIITGSFKGSCHPPPRANR